MSDVQAVATLSITDHFTRGYLEQYRFVPSALSESAVTVMAVCALDTEVLNDLVELYRRRVEVRTVTADELAEQIRRSFAESETIEALVRAEGGMPSLGDADTESDARDLANQPPVVRYVNMLLRDAAGARASDVHLEAGRAEARVRLRVDGVLSEYAAPPATMRSAVLSRLKLLAQLDVTERRLPQDGRMRLRLEGGELDLRISTVPSVDGESVVVRLLDRGGAPATLTGVGLSADVLPEVKRLVARPSGLVLVTGPTGSGKTTTLYAALALRDRKAEKIITVEDPVEYQVPGVVQVAVHATAGLTFAGALRSLLRQDPDVLMIGELRDRETASIAVQAAMTGHLVLATLHTNDAVSSVVRLLDLGVEPYLVAGTTEGILAQRLVRRVCSDCVAPYLPDPQVVAEVLGPGHPVPSLSLNRGLGCARCRGTGYRGRIGIFELFVMSEAARRMIARQPDLDGMRSLAAEQGMVTMRQDGWRKVRLGLTTPEEVLRVTSD